MKQYQTIKILVITPYFYPHTGGSERYMEELYGHIMKKYPHVRVDVLCYNTDNASSHEVYRNLSIYRVPGWQILKGQFALPNPWALAHALKQLSQNGYDYVHTQLGFFDTAWWGWSYAKYIGAKSIFTEHVTTHPVHKSHWVRIAAKLVYKTLVSWSIPRYDLILASNKGAKNFLLNEIKTDKPVHIVMGGVDTAFYSPSKIKKELPHTKKLLKPTDILVTYTGRMIWSKGVTFLFEAIKQAIPKLPSHVYFAFAGGGELENKLRRAAKSNGLNKRVFIMGTLNHKQVRSLLRMTDIFILPTHHNEGIPNSILEAGASGCFVISTQTSGVSEVINNRKNGLLVAQKDAAAIAKSLLWAVNNPKLRNVAATQLRRKIRQSFEWESIARKHYGYLSRSKLKV